MSWSLEMFLLEVLPHTVVTIRALIIKVRVVLSKRCLTLLIRRILYRQLEDSLNTWSSKVTAESIQTPKSFTTGEGLIFFPNRATWGRDKFRVSCGTPTTKTLVLFGLINWEVSENYLAISRRSLLRPGMATLTCNRGRARSTLVSST